MRNFRSLPDYVHMNTNNRINRKRPRFTIIQFYILIQFYIRGRFCASLPFRISDSIQPAKCYRKYCMDKTYHKLHHCTPARSKRHYALLHTPTILHTKIVFAILSSVKENIIQDKTVTLFTDTPTYGSHVIVHF